MSNFTFGTPTTTAGATGFGFGAQAQQPTAATGFGSTVSTFGTAAATPSLGQSAAQKPAGLGGFNLGGTSTAAAQPAQQTTGFNLGGTATATGGLFGAAAAPQATGLSFGTPNAAKPAGLTFGTPTASTGLTAGSLTTGGLTGALTTASLTGGLTTGGVPGGLNFNTTSTAGTTGGLNFGSITTTSAATSLNFGTTSTAGGLSFGTATSSAPPAASTLSFGATTTTSASSLFGTPTGGLFGAKPAATTAVAITTTAAATNRGLGGLDVSVTNKGLTQGSTSPTAAKENLLPNELMQTIDNFKEFVKTQKVLSSDIARGSARPLNRCAEDTASLMELLTTLAGSVQRDRSLADKLKQDTARALQSAEIAQRTHDTPAGLQYENTAPLLFFMDLAENFQHDLMLFKSQIETTEKHIQTMMTPKSLTPQELTMAMNKLHESLVAVAGKLQGVHSKVQQQKEQYLNFRKYVLKDSTNVFEDIKTIGKSSRNSLGRGTSGPTPFGAGNRSFMPTSALNSTQTPNLGTPNPLGKN